MYEIARNGKPCSSRGGHICGVDSGREFVHATDRIRPLDGASSRRDYPMEDRVVRIVEITYGFIVGRNMKKRVPSKISMASKGSRTANDSGLVTKIGLFTFPNGDSYEGEYRICRGQPLLARQGRGIYETDDFNRYEAVWDRDRIGDDLHIRFNDGTAYKGGLDKDGNMSGPGIYFLPDGSSVAAIWNKNRPSLDIRYREPLGFIWKGELSADGDVRFATGNHFWDEIHVPRENKSGIEATAQLPST